MLGVFIAWAKGFYHHFPREYARVSAVQAQDTARLVPRWLAANRRRLVVADQVMQRGDKPTYGVHQNVSTVRNPCLSADPHGIQAGMCQVGSG